MRFQPRNILSFFYQKPWWTLLIIALVTVPSVWMCLQLSLISDFKRLLPQEKPSVVALNRIIDRVGGVGVHQIEITADDPEAIIAFIDDLVIELRKLPEKYVRIIDYRIDDVKDFYTQNKYLFVDLEDLLDVEQRLEEKIEYEKLKANPFFFDLEDKPVGFDISDIEEKYESKTKEQDKFYKGYLISSDRKMGAVLVHPSGSTSGTSFSKELIGVIDDVVQVLNPSSYHPSMKVTYEGKYKKVLSQFQQLINDMLETLSLCLFFVACVLYLYFRRLRVIFLLTFCLSIGSAWAFALAEIFIGSLNSQTAFLGSIIVGNGINSGIFLLSRYFEERRKGVAYLQGIQTAVETTYLATFAAAVTTSVAFIALSRSEIQGMSEFGFIGGVGMVLCWIASYTFLPALLSITEKILPMHKNPDAVATGWTGVFSSISRLITRHTHPIVITSVLMVVGAAWVSSQFIPHSLEYDFSKLKNKYDKKEDRELRDQRAESIFGESLSSPSVILLDDPKQAEGLCETVMGLEAGLPENKQLIAECKMLQDFVPEDQPQKLQSLARIRTMLEDDTIERFYDKHQEDIDELRATKAYQVIELQNLPETMRRKYQEKSGELGTIAYVYADNASNISDGKNLIRFTDTLSSIELQDGSIVRISGDYPIFADLLKAIKRDGPIVSILSFLMVTLLIIAYFRRVRAVAFIIGTLSLATLLMLGIQSVFGIRLNFFNYIALPVTFGIGVDYAVNLYHRYRLEGQGKIMYALETTGGAIILCSMTTMIGYLSLTQGINQAMVSFGWLAFIGEVSCILAGLCMVPAMLHAIEKRTASKTTTS